MNEAGSSFRACLVLAWETDPHETRIDVVSVNRKMLCTCRESFGLILWFIEYIFAPPCSSISSVHVPELTFRGWLLGLEALKQSWRFLSMFWGWLCHSPLQKIDTPSLKGQRVHRSINQWQSWWWSPVRLQLLLRAKSTLEKRKIQRAKSSKRGKMLV